MAHRSHSNVGRKLVASVSWLVVLDIVCGVILLVLLGWLGKLVHRWL